MKKGIATGILVVLLVFASALTITPLLWMISASLMPTGGASVFPPRLLPERITLEHYEVLFSRLNLPRYFFNSVVVSVGVTVVSLFVNSLAGYAFAKYRFAGRERIFRFLLASMIVPGQVTMLPLFLMLNKLGLVNTYWGILIPSIASIFGIFLIRQYALGIPDSLIEAARLDGAKDFEIYWRIILPLCRPILVTLGLFTFMGTWNDFLWPLIIMTDESMYTLPVAIASLSGEHVQDTELMMAASVVTVLPVMIVFLSLQRFYVQGIMLGSLKG